MKCKGCGAILQIDHPDQLGYTPKKDSEYCQRCFRLIHYDDLQISMKTGIPADEVIQKIENMDALILWIVDMFDFEASMIRGLNRKFTEKDILLIGTKKDLLPQSLGEDKLAQFVFKRLKEYGLSVQELMFTSRNSKASLEDVYDAIDEHAHGRDIVVMGRANVGKSTLLNRLIGEDVLTASKYPGTTLDFHSIDHRGYHFIDTPGIEIEKTMLLYVDEKDLKTVLPLKPIKPKVYQLKDDQSFAVGGLARLDILEADKASAVFYVSNELPLHRSKLEKADEQWQKHYGELYQPVASESEFVTYHTKKDEEEAIDVVVHGLGWFTLHGKIKGAEVHVPKGVDVTFRKAMM